MIINAESLQGGYLQSRRIEFVNRDLLSNRHRYSKVKILQDGKPVTMELHRRVTTRSTSAAKPLLSCVDQ